MLALRRTITIVALGLAIALCNSPVLATTYTSITFSNLGFSGIYFIHTFWGYQSAVNRDTTGGQPAYDYAVHIIKTGEETGERCRMFELGRWNDGGGDGDHILQFTSPYGAANTWGMWSAAPDVEPGIEQGGAGTWWAGQIGDPEVVAGSDYWYMFVQTQIDPGMPVDTGQIATTQADRIELLYSTDCKNWTRWTARGVIVNIPSPAQTFFHHQEVMYVPWDSRPWWMYVGININGVFQGTYRIRSTTPWTFDYNLRETAGLAELGNQIGWIANVNGSPLFVRMTFVSNGSRTVPSMQFSRDGLNWTWGDGAPLQLEGSTDNNNNKNCYFCGMSTVNGTGELPFYQINAGGRAEYRIIYGATTCNSPVAPGIFYSEIGVGECKLEIYP